MRIEVVIIYGVCGDGDKDGGKVGFEDGEGFS